MKVKLVILPLMLAVMSFLGACAASDPGTTSPEITQPGSESTEPLSPEQSTTPETTDETMPDPTKSNSDAELKSPEELNSIEEPMQEPIEQPGEMQDPAEPMPAPEGVPNN